MLLTETARLGQGGSHQPCKGHTGDRCGESGRRRATRSVARVRNTHATLNELALHAMRARMVVHLALVLCAFVGVYGCAAMARGSALLSVKKVNVI